MHSARRSRIAPFLFAFVTLGLAISSPAQEPLGDGLPTPRPVARSGGFGIGTIRRTLERGRSSNERLNVLVVASRRPARGERVSVIPLQTGIVGAQLVIKSVDLFENPMNEGRQAGQLLPDYWQLEFEDNINLTILASSGVEARTGESSVDVAVLFPASPRARAIEPSAIPAGDLPDGFGPAAILVAVDADGDRTADFIAFEICEGNRRERAPADCDTVRTFVYERVESYWQLVDVTV